MPSGAGAGGRTRCRSSALPEPPFTLLTYAVEGGASRSFTHSKSLLFRDPAAAHRLLQKLTDTIIAYLGAQVQAGAQAVQLSTPGLASSDDKSTCSLRLPYPAGAGRSATAGRAPIYFAQGATALLEEIGMLPADVFAIDWRLPLNIAGERLGIAESADRAIQATSIRCACSAPSQTRGSRWRTSWRGPVCCAVASCSTWGTAWFPRPRLSTSERWSTACISWDEACRRRGGWAGESSNTRRPARPRRGAGRCHRCFPSPLALYALACTLHFVALAERTPSAWATVADHLGLWGGQPWGRPAVDGAAAAVGGRVRYALAGGLADVGVSAGTHAGAAGAAAWPCLPLVAMVLSVWSHALCRPGCSERAGRWGLAADAASHRCPCAQRAGWHRPVWCRRRVEPGLHAARAALERPHRPSGAATPGGQSLLQLDTWGWQGSVFGLLALTSALVSGTYLLMQSFPALGGGVSAALGLQARYLFSQPRYLLAVVTWLLFAGLLVGRNTLGLRGRGRPS